jgi:hypothetical protein
MLADSNIHVVQETSVHARPRKPTARHFLWVGLLTAVGVVTAFWVLVLMLVSHAFAFAISVRFAIGAGLAIAALSFVATAIAAIVTADRK